MQKTFFAPLRKIEDVDDGSIMVTGIASTEAPDSTGETILASAIKQALPAYRKFPAIREMHRSTSAAGRAVEIDVDAAGITHLTAHIVDADAVKKVKSKVYGGFSVGGKVVKRDKKDPTIITEILLAEISLVDRPAHPEAAITMWKIDAGAGDDSLAKIIGERDDLAKQLAARERAIGVLVSRVENTMAKVDVVISQNQVFRKQIADLTKRLSEKPRVAVDNVSAAPSQNFEKRMADILTLIEGAESAVRVAEADMAKTAALFALDRPSRAGMH
jgi:hypothetical protein